MFSNLVNLNSYLSLLAISALCCENMHRLGLLMLLLSLLSYSSWSSAVCNKICKSNKTNCTTTIFNSDLVLHSRLVLLNALLLIIFFYLFFPFNCSFLDSVTVMLIHPLVFEQVAESKLAKFVEDIIVPPRMVDIIVDGEVFMIFVCPPTSHVHIII